ncbi:MAG: hypothetical protein ABI995_11695 [Acidobacteriota bacterium]
MRTTVNLDADVLERVKSVAHDRKASFGEVLSDFARRGMERRVEMTIDPLTGLPVLHDPGGRTITSEEVYRLQGEEDLEKYQELMDKLSKKK